MSGGKGSKPAGNVTTTNLTGQKQEPYLEELWKGGQDLYNQYKGGGITATEGNPWIQMGLQNQADTARMTSQEWMARVYEPWLRTGGQTAADSPAYNYYQNLAQNQTGPQQQLQGLGGQAATAGQNFSNQIAQYAPQIAAMAPQVAGYASQIAQYAPQVAGYANQIAGYGNQLAQYAPQIAAYAPQIAAMAQQAGSNSNLGLSTLGSIAQGQGTGMQQLANTASGQYVNQNPWIDKTVQAAMDPITRNFQTAVDPTTNARYAASGRYGSGAMLGERQNNANTLASQLGNVSSQMYGQNYAQERQNQLSAANQYAGLQSGAGSNYGQLYNAGLNLGLTGLGAAANTLQGAGSTLQGAGNMQQAAGNTLQGAGGLQQSAANTLQGAGNMLTGAANVQGAAANPYFTGMSQAQAAQQPQLNAMLAGATGLQGGYQNASQNAINAAQLFPSLQAAAFVPSQMVQATGAGVNALQQQGIDDPYQALQRYQGTIGNPIGAGTSQPYFQNGMANTMAGITGGLDIMSKMGGMLGKI